MPNIDFTSLAALTFQYGPFVFALLFTLYVSRWTHRNYVTASTRTPSASRTEQRVHLGVYLGTTVFGMALVIASVVWWVRFRPAIHVFRGEIHSLKDYEKVVSKNLYFRSRRFGKLADNLPEVRDEEFVALQESPFAVDQEFEILFSKGSGNPETFSVKYAAKVPAQNFKIEWDEKENRNRLIRLNESPRAALNWLPIVLEAHASQVTKGARIPAATQKASSAESRDLDRSSKWLVSVLQDEKADIGSKIKTLDRLKTLDQTSLRGIAVASTEREPVLLTLYDLSRHNDKELAFKSKALLSALEMDRVVSEQLLSKDPASRSEATRILLRLDKADADRILRMPGVAQSALSKPISAEISRKVPVTPRPTGSAQGDRYYVKAAWNPNDKQVTSCLTSLFNKELLNRPSLEKEAEFMKGRKERVAYWYSKDWALHMASKITECGGTASFVSP
jgi:hypothetical protein